MVYHVRGGAGVGTPAERDLDHVAVLRRLARGPVTVDDEQHRLVVADVGDAPHELVLPRPLDKRAVVRHRHEARSKGQTDALRQDDGVGQTAMVVGDDAARRALDRLGQHRAAHESRFAIESHLDRVHRVCASAGTTPRPLVAPASAAMTGRRHGRR